MKINVILHIHKLIKSKTNKQTTYLETVVLCWSLFLTFEVTRDLNVHIMKMKSGFRNTQWDPLLLCSQIIAIQTIVYVTLGLTIAIMDVFVDANHTLDHIFQYHEIHVTDVGGQSVILSFVLNAFIGALALRFIVGRTKLCLDFSCTFHFIHLIICWGYNGTFPSTFSWWFLNAVCATLMCVFGEFLCLKIELKEIPVGYTPLDTKADL